ncbi:CBM35 domain-containing protein [Cohnella massiliensis]|uniref:CBM35 domain-containing protein n=1 Tax=Cohnella massiliensis TaxID=1816691 RepID=UPI0009BA8C06|nr:CBM35 domain-containing protein [Cohnella massiliensis]
MFVKMAKTGLSAMLALSFALALLGAPGKALAVSLEAESATLSGGAVVETEHAGYSGAGFVGGFTDGNKGNALVRFSYTAASAGAHTAALRYANGTGSDKTLSLYVNGAKIRQTTLPATAGWSSWAAKAETLTLAAGANTIGFKFDDSDSGNVNLDKIDIDVPAPADPNVYEAEAAALSGGASVATEHAGYSGAGFVDGFTDGNKGSAAVTFSVNAAEAGSRDITLRYANGTGSAKTLSLYVNGVKLRQIALAATAGWSAWGTHAENVTLNAGANSIVYKFDQTDSGNVNLDRLVLGPVSADPEPGAPNVYEAEEQFYSGGVTRTASGLTNFVSAGARAVFTVNAGAAGNASAELRYANGTGSAKTLNVYVNGLFALATTLPATGGPTVWASKTETLPLRKGLNTISYRYDSANSGNVSLDSLTLAGGAALAARGATLPYAELEAENGATNAQLLGPGRNYLTVEAESSGRRAVKLTQTGHYVEWTAPKSANALVVRYSMPDSAGGGGTNTTLSLYVNGTKRQALDLTSRYAWTYGAYPYNDNPANGNAHRFYDESRFLVSEIQAGATVRLQKDSGDTAAYYTIDLIDLEQADAPYAMPAGFVSITSFGAVANDAGDDTAAIRAAIADARSTGMAGVWIPAGTFRMNDRVDVSDIHIRGAGTWHSELLGTGGKGGFYGVGGNVTVADLALTGDSLYRNDAADHAGFEGNFGAGSLIQNVWIEHMKVGYWLQAGTDGLYVVGGNVRNTWADGVNLHGGVKNTTVSHLSVRNTGDDAFAMWSDGAPNENNSFRYNTAQAPMLANAFALYGGKDNKILDNVGADTVTASSGIVVSTRFNAVSFSGTTELKRNTLLRTGGWEPNWNTSFGGLWIYAENQNITAPIAIEDVEIKDSTYEGVKFSYNRTIQNVSFNRVSIEGAGTFGLNFDGVTGTGTFGNVTVSGAASGALNNPNNLFTIVRGPGNVGW